MEEIITWKEAFLGEKGLKDLRTENNLNIPEYYRKSTWRLAMALWVYGIVFGALCGALFFIIQW